MLSYDFLICQWHSILKTLNRQISFCYFNNFFSLAKHILFLCAIRTKNERKLILCQLSKDLTHLRKNFVLQFYKFKFILISFGKIFFFFRTFFWEINLLLLKQIIVFKLTNEIIIFCLKISFNFILALYLQ